MSAKEVPQRSGSAAVTEGVSVLSKQEKKEAASRCTLD